MLKGINSSGAFKMTISDPYAIKWAVTQRLINDFKKHGNIVVAFDFDNTIYDCHQKGFRFDGMVDLLLECQREGLLMFCWTGNCDHSLVSRHCLSLGLESFNINCSPVELKEWDSPKPFYSILLDDRAGLQSSMASLKDFLIYKKSLA